MLTKKLFSYLLIIFLLFVITNKTECKEIDKSNNNTLNKSVINQINNEKFLNYRGLYLNVGKKVKLYKSYREIYLKRVKEPKQTINTESQRNYNLKIYPVPTNDKITLNVFSNSVNTLNIEIFSELGNRLLIKALTVNIGINLIDFDLNHFDQGSYYLFVNDGVHFESSKFLIIR